MFETPQVGSRNTRPKAQNGARGMLFTIAFGPFVLGQTVNLLTTKSLQAEKTVGTNMQEFILYLEISSTGKYFILIKAGHKEICNKNLFWRSINF